MTRPLRIAHVVTSLTPGGAERQGLVLAEGLPRDRFQVDFLAIGGPGEYDDRARAAGAGVILLGARPTPGESSLAGHRRRIGVMAAFVRTIRQGRYDIVDAWLYPDDVRAATTRWLTGVRVVMSGRRNIQAHDRLGPLAGLLDRAVDRWVDAVVANSDASARFALESHHTNSAHVHVIRNGVEPIEPIDDEARRSWRERMGVGPDDVVVGCVGRLRRVKRAGLLIDAVARLVPERPDLRLVFVGEGDERPMLERKIRDLGLEGRVLLHGTELDPRPMYGAFDLVAQSSASEGLPNVLLEAAAAGRPIVATDAGGSNEIVIDGRTGLLVPIEDVDRLAGALARLLDDADLRRQLGAAAREHVQTAFGVGRFVREYGELYERMAADKGVRRD
jgi:glycosyltransferase involved in cell wall biosynthesis